MKRIESLKTQKSFSTSSRVHHKAGQNTQHSSHTKLSKKLKSATESFQFKPVKLPNNDYTEKNVSITKTTQTINTFWRLDIFYYKCG